MPIDITDDRPVLSEVFRKAMEVKKATNALSGVDVCDVQDCYCKTESTMSKSNTPMQSESGSATPKETGEFERGLQSAKDFFKMYRKPLVQISNFFHWTDADPYFLKYHF